MPRIENCGKNVDAYCQKTGNGSSTHDICADCAQSFDDQPTLDARLEACNGDPQGDEGWAIGPAHPPYDDCDYRCELCGKQLTGEDD